MSSAGGPFRAYRTASGKSVLQMLTEFGARAEASLGRALYREGTGIIEAARGITPRDTTTLASAEGVAEPRREENLIVVELGVGGAAGDKRNPKTGEMASSYALYVHENLEAHHPTGTAKFIEIPFNQAKRGMAGRIAESMRNDLKGVAPGAGIGGEGLGEPEV